MDYWLSGDQVNRIHSTVIVYPDVEIEEGVTIYPYAVIGRPPQGAGMIPPKAATRPTRIGAGSVIGAHVTLYAGVQMGPECLIGDGVVVREDVTLGTRAVIGQNATVQPGASIGNRTRVLDLSHVTAGARIGNDVFWSVNVISLNDDTMNRGGDLEFPSVADGARLGAGSVVLPGRHVGAESVVGAGAVVTHDVEDGAQVRGIPARPIDFYDMMGGYDGRFEAAKAAVDQIAKAQANGTMDELKAKMDAAK
jgi:acetyltransferase-like isoleucine patch superfamily enzyme